MLHERRSGCQEIPAATLWMLVVNVGDKHVSGGCPT